MPSKNYQGFADKLHHDTPGWVPTGSLFHIRIRSLKRHLASPDIAPRLLASALHYHERRRWWLGLFLVMPDHLHALLAFESNDEMSSVIKEWKRFHCRTSQIQWQDNFFDHRLRPGHAQLDQQVEYILRNPVALGLCHRWSDWPWVINQML